MGKKRKIKERPINNECDKISQEQWIMIHTEAYYRALKKIDEDNKYVEVTENDNFSNDILFLLNVLFFPWKINKKYSISNRICDSLLVFIVSGILKGMGIILWLLGIIIISDDIYQIILNGISSNRIAVFSMGLLILIFGSMFMLSSKEFEKETDSNKIYAYSGCIIAMISCLISVIALVV